MTDTQRQQQKLEAEIHAFLTERFESDEYEPTVFLQAIVNMTVRILRNVKISADKELKAQRAADTRGWLYKLLVRIEKRAATPVIKALAEGKTVKKRGVCTSKNKNIWYLTGPDRNPYGMSMLVTFRDVGH
jgi:hypothetical protein